MTAVNHAPILIVGAQKVLAIDDEEIMGYVIQRIVRHLGYEVDWVRSCETALEKIRRGRYDVILSDFKNFRIERISPPRNRNNAFRLFSNCVFNSSRLDIVGCAINIHKNRISTCKADTITGCRMGKIRNDNFVTGFYFQYL